MTTQPLTDDEVRGLRQPWAEKATPLAPRIVATIDSLKADLEQALELLEGHQWDGWWVGSNHPAPMTKEHLHCSTCDGHASDSIEGVPDGHATNCSLANLLSKYNREVRFHD